MNAVWAEEVLRNRGGSLNERDARALTLLATDGDEAAAAKAVLEVQKREVWGKNA